MEEIWKPIDGYSNYCVSNKGRVKSLGNNRSRKEKILKPHTTKAGYLMVQLWKDGKGKDFTVHRLVAQAFIPNTEDFPQCNHLDENKTNNCVENLEWCTAKFNHNYGTRNERMAAALKGRKRPEETVKKISAALSKPVLQIDPLNDKIIKEWKSATEVKRTLGFNNRHISECCNGKLKSCGGFKWRFK